MIEIDPLAVFFRWLHVITACVVIGSGVFMRLILPVGLKGLEPAAAEAVFLRCRRALKFVVHSGILLFLISGIFNALKNWGVYKQSHLLTHSLFGTHLLLALIAWAIMLRFLAGPAPFAGFGKWTKINLLILALTVAAASTLKSVREAIIKNPPANASSAVAGARP